MRDVLKEIDELSPKDKSRLFQCITCKHDPKTCGRDESNEDANGFCKDYAIHTYFSRKIEKEKTE